MSMNNGKENDTTKTRIIKNKRQEEKENVDSSFFMDMNKDISRDLDTYDKKILLSENNASFHEEDSLYINELENQIKNLNTKKSIESDIHKKMLLNINEEIDKEMKISIELTEILERLRKFIKKDF